MSSIYNNQSVLARSFPPPEYLTMPAAGINISDYAIKVALLKQKKNRIHLAAHGKVDIPLDTVEHGEIKDAGTLVKLLSRLKDEYDFKYAHLALPEEHAYLFQMELPQDSKGEVQELVEFHLKENVPFGADEALFDYSIARETKEKYELNVSVYPVTVASEYITVFREAGITPLSIEIEGQATARALLAPDYKKSTLIVDVGRNEASLSISTDGVVTFTANLEAGGDFFTRAIARQLDISFQEAEAIKRKSGFRNTRDSAPVFSALQPVVADLKESIRKHLTYWQMHSDVVTGNKQAVERIVLVGGTANIAGLPEYLEAELDVPVEVGNVWQNIFSFDEHIPEINANQSLEFATAVGLALRNLERNN